MSQDIKIAFLCLAHNNFLYLSSLSKYCCSDGDGFFIHLDRKVKGEKLVSLDDRTILVEDDYRFRTRWGTLGIVNATLKLLELSLQKNKYDRFILISGSDLPLLTKSELKKKLDNSSEYISVWDEVEINRSKGDLAREFFKAHFYNTRITNPGEAYLTQNRFRIHLSRYLNFFLQYLPIRRKYTFSKYYKGSQWWCISAELAAYFIKETETSCLLSQFKHMHAPDEKFFQTLAMNSVFKNNLISKNSQEDLIHGIHYINWGVNSKTTGMTAFTLEKLRDAKKHNAMFARKINNDKTPYIKYIKYLNNHEN